MSTVSGSRPFGSLDALDDPVVTELFITIVCGFAGAITEHSQQVAGSKLNRVLLEYGIVEQPDDEAARQ